MSKQTILLFGAIVIAGVVFWLFVISPQSAEAPDDEVLVAEETNLESTEITDNAGSEAVLEASATPESQTATAPATPPVSPPATQQPSQPSIPEAVYVPEGEAPELQSGDYVDVVLAGSERCEWIDPATGVQGIALVKDGAVRIETDLKVGTSIKLYTSLATYTWMDGEKEGTVYLKNIESSEEVTTQQTEAKLSSYLNSGERVKCKVSTLNDDHFSPPKKVTFTQFEL